MQEIIITMGNLYAHNVISYRKGGTIIDIEKLANKIIEFEAEYNWYDLVDDYGNIKIDDEKADKFPAFKANGKNFEILKVENHYEIKPKSKEPKKTKKDDKNKDGDQDDE